jgi:biopolymer transport protein ExbD/biopolymer transport protein TolR
MGANMGSKQGPISDINVTPLIDVVLVLLVVFMVVTPLLQSGMPVDLPQATQASTVNDVGQFIVISVMADCSEGPDACETQGWYVEQDEVDEITILDAINAEYQKSADRSILIKGDNRLPYKHVREVMDVLASHNITTLMIAAKKGD